MKKLDCTKCRKSDCYLRRQPYVPDIDDGVDVGDAGYEVSMVATPDPVKDATPVDPGLQELVASVASLEAIAAHKDAIVKQMHEQYKDIKPAIPPEGLSLDAAPMGDVFWDMFGQCASVLHTVPGEHPTMQVPRASFKLAFKDAAYADNCWICKRKHISTGTQICRMGAGWATYGCAEQYTAILDREATLRAIILTFAATTLKTKMNQQMRKGILRIDKSVMDKIMPTMPDSVPTNTGAFYSSVMSRYFSDWAALENELPDWVDGADTHEFIIEKYNPDAWEILKAL